VATLRRAARAQLERQLAALAGFRDDDELDELLTSAVECVGDRRRSSSCLPSRVARFPSWLPPSASLRARLPLAPGRENVWAVLS